MTRMIKFEGVLRVSNGYGEMVYKDAPKTHVVSASAIIHYEYEEDPTGVQKNKGILTLRNKAEIRVLGDEATRVLQLLLGKRTAE